MFRITATCQVYQGMHAELGGRAGGVAQAGGGGRSNIHRRPAVHCQTDLMLAALRTRQYCEANSHDADQHSVSEK